MNQATQNPPYAHWSRAYKGGLIFLPFLWACSKQPASTEFSLQYAGIAQQFTQSQSPRLGGARVVDSSLVTEGDSVSVFYDYGDGSAIASASLSDENAVPHQLPAGLNFTYVTKQAGTYYMFGQRNWDIYLRTSADGITWSEANEGQPVLTHDADVNSNWHRLWNIGVDVSDDGTWHLFAECAIEGPGQRDVGLCYATSPDAAHFDSGKQALFLPHGGNPYVKWLTGRGLLIIHGEANDPTEQFPGGYWYTTATTIALDGTVTNHKDVFAVGIPAVHICDPHMIETTVGLTLVVSVDQSHVTLSVAPGLTFESLFDQLTGQQLSWYDVRTKHYPHSREYWEVRKTA